MLLTRKRKIRHNNILHPMTHNEHIAELKLEMSDRSCICLCSPALSAFIPVLKFPFYRYAGFNMMKHEHLSFIHPSHPPSLPPSLPPRSSLIMLLKWCVAGESAALVLYITVKESRESTVHHSTVPLTVGGQCSPK